MSNLSDNIKELINAYSDTAPEDAIYPYSVFELRQISAEDDCQKYVLEVNVWDSYRTYSRVDLLANEIKKRLHKQIITNSDRCISSHLESNNHVIDEDKQIKRVRLQFSLSNYEKEI